MEAKKGCGIRVWCRHFEAIGSGDRRTTCGQFCIDGRCHKQVLCEKCNKPNQSQ